MATKATVKYTNVRAIKAYFAREDDISPEGQNMTAKEMMVQVKALTSDDKKELGALAAAELGGVIG